MRPTKLIANDVNTAMPNPAVVRPIAAKTNATWMVRFEPKIETMCPAPSSPLIDPIATPNRSRPTCAVSRPSARLIVGMLAAMLAAEMPQAAKIRKIALRQARTDAGAADALRGGSCGGLWSWRSLVSCVCRIDSIDSIRLSYQFMTTQASGTGGRPNLAAVAALAGVSAVDGFARLQRCRSRVGHDAGEGARRGRAPQLRRTGSARAARFAAAGPASSASSWRSGFATRSATR